MACSCGKKTCGGKKGCTCDHSAFLAPMSALWQIYDGIDSKANAQVVAIAWEREDGKVFRYDLPIPKRLDPQATKHVSYVVERIAKFIVWSAGGWKLYLAGPDAIVKPVAKAYAKKGARAFDYDFFTSIYGRPVEAVVVPLAKMPEFREKTSVVKTVADGCRIGFDLGGSDRKCAAVIDGKVVHTEEVEWNPYFEKNPEYHRQGIRDSIRRAAEKLPRVDAIGGSAAGVYVNNQPRLASLFRGISKEDFAKYIVSIFDEIQEEYKVPVIVANDGEVTALAGAMSMNSNGVLGLSMGTSEAVGYVNLQGNITDWLNELAFAPIDYRDNAPVDEWSGDIGCGAQYFSQQAVARLAPFAGLNFPAEMKFPERLVKVQELMAQNDQRAAAIYRSIGVCFGYAIAHYADFYEIKNLLILGRVTSGQGGEIILDEARKVLEAEFPELAANITFRTPDEKFKRHGQAVIAASLPEIKK